MRHCPAWLQGITNFYRRFESNFFRPRELRLPGSACVERGGRAGIARLNRLQLPLTSIGKDGAVHQQDGDVILHRIDAAAAGALQGILGGTYYQRLFTGRAHQFVQQVFPVHGRDFTTLRCRPTRAAAKMAVRLYTEIRETWQPSFLTV